MTVTSVGFNQIVTSATVNNGDTLDVLFGGTAVDTTVNVGGTEQVFSGGTAIGTIVNNAGHEDVFGGTVINTFVAIGGIEEIFFGGTAVGTFVSGLFATQSIQTGGTASATTLINGGAQAVFTGGIAIGTNVDFNSTEVVNPGGTAISTLVEGGTLQDAGTTIGATIVGGGSQENIDGGATASGTTVSAGGLELDDGTAIGTTVGNGGTEDVRFGTAIGTVVNVGGEQVVLASGTASGTTINGGKVEVQSGGSIGSGPITFTNSGGILQLDASQSFQGLIAGFASPSGVLEEIDLVDITFGKTTKVSFKEAQDKLSGTLTVTDGTHTANLTLLGQYSAHDFTLASDGGTGTMITDPAASNGGHPVLAPSA
jgi:autotransporter passenger strand-loop-strand repeat protein